MPQRVLCSNHASDKKGWFETRCYRRRNKGKKGGMIVVKGKLAKRTKYLEKETKQAAWRGKIKAEWIKIK